MFRMTSFLWIGGFACALCVGSYLLAGGFGEPSKREATVQPKAEGNAAEVAKLGKENVESAENAYAAWVKTWTKDGTVVNEQPFGIIYQLSMRWLNAEIDIAKTRENRIQAYDRHAKRMKEWASEYQSLTGTSRLLIVQSAQKEAEFWLARERLAGK